MGGTADILADALRDAVERGELESSPDPEELLAYLMGPLVFRVVVQRASVDRSYIERVVRSALTRARHE